MTTHSDIIKAADHSAKRMTAKLRSSAYQSGWPPHISRQLTIKHDGGDNFYVDYPKQIEKDVLALEQGTQNTPPNAAILRFMNRLYPHIDNYVDLLFVQIMNMEIFK